MLGLARQDLENVWLERIEFADAGESISLAGRTLRAEDVPSFLRRLREEEVFAGRRFRTFEIERGTALARGTRIAIYPTGSEVWSAAAANASPAIITAATNRITLHDDGDEDQIVLASAHRFSHVSPRARLYVVDSPVSYLCDVDAGVLWRVDGYAITASQPTDVAAAPLASGRPARTAEWIERCRFEYLPGTPARSGLVTLEIVIASEGERVRLLQQVPIPNAP